MNILYYQWNENSSDDIKSAFEESGYSYIEITYKIRNYDSEPEFEEQVNQLLQSYPFDIIFTFNYFPIISKIAQNNKLPYVSWIYDCPHLTLYSTTIRNPYNFLFIFDPGMYQQVLSLGAKNVFNLDLAVNTKRLNSQLSLPHSINNLSYKHEVSFVGSLYENNMYRQIQYLPATLSGYLDGIMNAQQKIWGYSFWEELLTEDIVAELQKYLIMDNNSNYSFSAKDIYIHMLEANTTFKERTKLLQVISNQYRTDIYSGSSLNEIKNCNPHGFISYTDKMPFVFHETKINLNISLRSIRQGIPLRCLDIMGAGGFLLSNFQPELLRLFEPNVDFACYDSEEDLTEKIHYFLNHESERKEIAQNGWKKIQTQYSYQMQLQNIFDRVFCSN